MLAPKRLICLLLLTQIFKYLDSLDMEDSKDLKSGYSITFVSIFRLPFFRCTLFCCFRFWNEFYFFQEQLFNFYLFLLFRCYLSLNLHSWPFIVLLMSYSWSFQFLSFFLFSLLTSRISKRMLIMKIQSWKKPLHSLRRVQLR